MSENEIPVSHAKTPHEREEWANAAVREDDFSMDPEVIRTLIQKCNDRLVVLGEFQDRCRRELYMESMGIGEEYLEVARLIVQKYKDKAIGGGQIADHSSAVGRIEGSVEWTRNMRLDLEAMLKATLERDQENAGNINAVGGDL